MVAATLVALTLLSAQSPAPAPADIPDTAGTATLRGQITDALTGQPVVGARVRAVNSTGMVNLTLCALNDCDGWRGGDGRNPRYVTTTGSDGRYEFRGLRPGEYVITAGNAGYLPRSFGQVATDAPEGRVNVPAGQATTVDISLERPGTVSGRIVSDSKEALAGVELELVRRTYAPGGAVFRGVLFVQTESDGTFMFRDVRPGEYYVHAYSPGGHRPARSGPGAAYTSTYFPDAISLDGAQRIAVGSGQELSSIDFALRAVRTHSVSGLLVDAAGPPLTSARVQLTPLERGAVVEGPATTAAPDGTFRLEDVLPGSYIVTVGDDAASDRWMGATRQITVVDDRTVLVIPATPGSRFEGRVTIPEDEALPFAITNLSVRISQRWADSSALSTFGGDIATDGTFAFTGGVGETSVVMGGRIPPGWHIRSVAIDGIDMTDRPFDVLPTDRRRIDIVLSARGGTLQGITTDRDAKPVPQALVVLFPDDWARLSRTRLVRTAFSIQRGRFEMDDIPPGNYRAVAVRWLPRDAWTDGEVLARLWPSSEPVTISADEPVRLQLMVTEPPEDLFR